MGNNKIKTGVFDLKSMKNKVKVSRNLLTGEVNMEETQEIPLIDSEWEYKGETVKVVQIANLNTRIPDFLPVSVVLEKEGINGPVKFVRSLEEFIAGGARQIC